MRYYSGRRFNPQDYRYGAWLYDPFVGFLKILTKICRKPIPVAEVYNSSSEVSFNKTSL